MVWCVAAQTGQNPLELAGRSSGTKWVLWQADGDTWCGVWLWELASTHLTTWRPQGCKVGSYGALGWMCHKRV